MKELNILEEANNIIHGDRQESYGTPWDNHGCTAVLVSTWLSRKYRKDIVIDAEDVCFFNILQKVSREANSHRRDNLIDIAGYTGNVEMIKDMEISTIHRQEI